MKTEKTIYVKCDKYRLTKKQLFSVLVLATALAALSFVLNFSSLITEISAYMLLAITSFIAASCLYLLYTEPPHHYIFINQDEISFKQNKNQEEVCLKFDGVDYFETRFSEIIFCTKQQEKVVLPLNRISNEKKRWEIKEFLRTHITQLTDRRQMLKQTA